MKAFAVSIGLALAVAGCTMESEEDQLENQVRNMLAGQGNVTDVQLTRQDENNMSGFADMRANVGGDVRLACTARRTQGTQFQINCVPAVTDRVVQDIETDIRNRLSQQGEVLEVDLNRQDDMRMTGHARVRGPDGTEVRTNCTATRTDPNSLNFNWECNPA